MSAAKGAETDEGCWTERNAAGLLAWRVNLQVQLEHRYPTQVIDIRAENIRQRSRCFVNSGAWPTPLIRPPLRCATGRPPSPTRLRDSHK